MKDKHFFKVIAIFISLAVLLTFSLVRTTDAQIYVTVATDHDIDVDSNYPYFSMEYLATAYFEIKFDIETIKDGSKKEDVEIILSADNDEGDYEVDDDDTFIYYLGEAAYSSAMSSYDDIGPDDDGDIELPSFPSLFWLAKEDDPDDWGDYTWAGSTIERITVILVSSDTTGTISATTIPDIVRIKEYKFEDSPGGNDHEDSQDFGDYDDLDDAGWDILGGAPIIDTSDDTLYLRSSYLAQYEAYYVQCGYYPDAPLEAIERCDGKDNNWDCIVPDNELDKDEDGFMICEGDCDDSDDSVYPGASGTYKGKDNNCNGIMDKDEKKRPSYPIYTPILPSWTQYQQLWRQSLLPLYMERQKQMWNQYQLTSYNQLLIQSIFSGGQFWFPYTQPYWYQSYSPYWFNGINTMWPGGLSFIPGITTFSYQLGYPLLTIIGQGLPSQQKTTDQEKSRLKTEAIDLSNVQTDNQFINNYSLGALDIPLKVPQYNLPLQFNEISNFEDFSTKISLSYDALNLLKENGFAVINNPFDPKEEDITTPYKTLKDEEIPIFITSDSLLHLYHIQFDETLRQIEEREFYDKIWEISQSLLDDAIEKYTNTTGDLKEAFKRNVAYLSVGLSLLQPKQDQLCNLNEWQCDDPGLASAYFTEEDLINYSFTIPDFVETEVRQELDLMEAHAGFSESPVFIYKEDYSQYVPRGHYTRSEKLKNYFMAFIWYGRISMLLKGSDSILTGSTDPANPEAFISTYDAMIQTMQACLIALKFAESQELRSKWDRIYSVTAFYVGLSDDLGPYEYKEAMDAVFGGEFGLNDLTEEKLLEIKAKLAEYRSPKIFGGTGDCAIVPPFNAEQADECLEKTKGFRLMGQRFIPDSYMFSNLVFPKASTYVGDRVCTDVFTCVYSGAGPIRGFPRGLDVMALLGSERSKDILIESGDDQYEDYYNQIEQLEDEFSQFDETEWNQNLYWSWLFALKSLLKEFGIGYPTFMQTQAWEDKELTTALASWTELRHDTILYAKQSYTGYGGYPPPEKPAVGYIEPVPEFYNRLLALTKMTTDGLDEMAVLDDASKNRLQSLENILVRLIDLSKKELENEELSQADYDFIKDFGKELNAVIADVDELAKKTTIIADVHTDGNSEQVLEEGVGYVKLMVVAYKVPDGQILIGAGPVMTYYEFKQPMSNRLTDEMWKVMLDSNPPQEPEWIFNFSE